MGNQVVQYEVDGRQVLLNPTDLSTLAASPFWYGIPILSPPNRVRNSTFRSSGRSYVFPNNLGEHHIHGEIGYKSWKVADYGSNEKQGAYVTSHFSYVDHPECMTYFPHELTLSFTYSLKEGVLSLYGHVRNDCREEAPLALGFHPYFNISLGSKEAAHFDLQFRLRKNGLSLQRDLLKDFLRNPCSVKSCAMGWPIAASLLRSD